MGKRVYSVEEIELQGWENPIRIYPLVIKKFKILGDILEKFTKPTEGEPEKTFAEVLVEATAYCMRTYEPELSDPDVLEDYIDFPTMSHILEVAGGIKLNDPNLQAAMAAGMTS